MSAALFKTAGRNFSRTRARFANLTWRDAAALYLRALRLHWAGPPARPVPPRPERIVVTLSTIPSRIAHLRPVLSSLLDQSVPADRIVVALPEFSVREWQDYPPAGELDLPTGVEALACEDMGPATKFFPALAAEPEAALIVVDDDVIYPFRFIETLLAAHREHPSCALGYRGVRFEPGVPYPDLQHVFASALSAASPVDVLFGTWGYLLPPGVLTHPTTGAVPEELRWVDDVWVSGNLARAGVPRLVIASDQFPVETPGAMRNALSGTLNRDGSNDLRAVEAFMQDW